MPSKKKPKPLFEVPVEIGSRRESGWVYRSEPAASPSAERIPSVERISSAADSGLRGMSISPLALAMSALAQTIVLGLTIAAIPLSMGIQALQSIGRPDGTR